MLRNSPLADWRRRLYVHRHRDRLGYVQEDRDCGRFKGKSGSRLSGAPWYPPQGPTSFLRFPFGEEC